MPSVFKDDTLQELQYDKNKFFRELSKFFVQKSALNRKQRALSRFSDPLICVTTCGASCIFFLFAGYTSFKWGSDRPVRVKVHQLIVAVRPEFSLFCLLREMLLLKFSLE